MCGDGHIHRAMDWMKRVHMVTIECINVQSRNSSQYSQTLFGWPIHINHPYASMMPLNRYQK